MNNPTTQAFQSTFTTRLDTLEHLLQRGRDTFKVSSSLLELRLAPDMAPFGTQIAFTCNQPRNFALWLQGRPADNLDSNVATLEQADSYIHETKKLLSSTSADDTKLAAATRVDLGPGMYAEMSGMGYVNDFLIPNFYFHLVTVYDILRMAGVAIGKADYMRHLMPFVRRS